jgi:transposase
MKASLHNEIVRHWSAGTSQRQIARHLGLSRHTVARVLADWQAARSGDGPPPGGLVPDVHRASQLDAYEATMQELLGRYPNLTAVRMYEELRARSFGGGYTIVRERLRQLRPRPTQPPVLRFETGPGLQAQMDYGVYDLDFTAEGRRRVYLFSYLLSYSRRQYLHLVEAQDFTTTIREHVRAFAHLQGVAATCLYDNQTVVVLRHDEDGPISNPRFLAFATHYGFKPWACKPHRPQTKGKVEKIFHYVETSLLNGRTFATLAQLNEVTGQWLATVADVRLHRQTQETPLARHAREVPHLIPLPAQPYDTACVVYRLVNAEGFIAYRQNFYSVPWCYIGRLLPVRITEDQVLVYGPNLEDVAQHALLARTLTAQRQVCPNHHPLEDPQQRYALLQERFAELGPVASRFLDALVRQQRQGKHQAQHVLALLASYERQDWLAALERALHFGAYSLAAIERILAATARPRSILACLADQERQHLDPRLRDQPIAPRPTATYQHLLQPEVPPNGSPSPTPESLDPPPAPDAGSESA